MLRSLGHWVHPDVGIRVGLNRSMRHSGKMAAGQAEFYFNLPTPLLKADKATKIAKLHMHRQHWQDHVTWCSIPTNPKMRMRAYWELQDLHNSDCMGRSRGKHPEPDKPKRRRIPKEPSDVHWKVLWTKRKAETECQVTVVRSGRASAVWALWTLRINQDNPYNEAEMPGTESKLS